MSQRSLFSIVESPSHPNFSELYQRLHIDELRFGSTRHAIQALKTQAPDLVVAEFFYGYGNNYAGVNLSNLDVFLHSLQKYAPLARVIIMVEKAEQIHVEKLRALFPIHAVLPQPVLVAHMEVLLSQDKA